VDENITKVRKSKKSMNFLSDVPKIIQIDLLITEKRMLAFWQRKPVFAASSGQGLVLIFNIYQVHKTCGK